MNTPDISQITEPQVAAWIAAKRFELNIHELSIYATAAFPTSPRWIVTKEKGFDFVTGATIDEAMSNLPTREQLAEQKRESARKLMAEADAISAPVYLKSA